MPLNFEPIDEKLQKKLTGICTMKEEPKIALLFEDNSTVYINVEESQLWLPPEGEFYGGRQLDEDGAGDVFKEIRSEDSYDGQGKKESESPSGEI